MSKKIKIFAIVAGIIALIIAVASFMGGDKEPVPNGNVLTSTTGSGPLPGMNTNATQQSSDEFSAILSTINTINIDTSFFQNSGYKLLRDVPVSLGSDIVGRSNPFAPIGSDAEGAVAADVTIQTIQTGKITGTTAEFAAQVSVNDTAPTTVVFEYGPTDTFGSATAPVSVTKSGTVLVTVSGLTSSTLYHVRAVAVRGTATTTGNVTTFVTLKK